MVSIVILLLIILVLFLVISKLLTDLQETREELNEANEEWKEATGESLEAERRAMKHFKKLIAIENLLKAQQYNSVENLTNKIKTILTNTDTDNTVSQ